MKLSKMDFQEFKFPEYIWNDGFMFQWCCKCKALHIYHFHIVRGDSKDGDKDYVIISCAGYSKLSKLRKFYEKHVKGDTNGRKANKKDNITIS